MRLFQISNAIEKILAKAVDWETGEITEEGIAALEQLEGDKAQKALDVALYLLGERLEGEAVLQRARELTARAERHERRAARLEKYLAGNLTPGEKLRNDRVEISWRKSSAVVIDNLDEVPFSFLRLVPERHEPDKATIAAHIRAGNEVGGAHLEVRHNLVVK